MKRKRPNTISMEKDSQWRPPSVMLLFLVCCGVFFFMVNILQLDNYIEQPHAEEIVYEVDLEETLKGFLVKSSGCRIPFMDPFDSSILKSIQPQHPITCNYSKPPLFDSNATNIFKIKSSEDAYNLGNYTEVSCCYKSFVRVEPKDKNGDNSEAKFSECTPVNESAFITQEFVEVLCKADGTIIYQDYFSFVPPKKIFNKRWKRRPLNVLIVGIDALSRLNFIRQMPRTVEFLQTIGAFEFKGFNKVGDNTFPNLVPALTGHTVEEIGNKCWNNSYFDDCPFIWKDYSENGYVTSYAEDCSWMGTFYYLKKGFEKQPTDYYWTFYNAVSRRQIGNTKIMNVHFCIGGRYQFRTITEYTKKFVESLHRQQKPYFSFFWSNSMSHDELNTPQLADEDYLTLLRDFYNNGQLENTVLMVMSDHGMRWGSIRSTYQGMLEESLPVLMLRFPQWYRDKFSHLMDNMQLNTRQLVTQFDVYETLKDLLNPYDISDRYFKRSQRGYSLFNKIPENRTCEEAGIASHWCTCQTTVPVNISDPMVLTVTNFTVDYINEKLENFTQCANLSIDKIFDARLSQSQNATGSGVIMEDYTVHFRTRPGGALFEVTVRHYHKAKVTVRFEIIGTISRTNLYADQSKCISDFRMRLYCYCEYFN